MTTPDTLIDVASMIYAQRVVTEGFLGQPLAQKQAADQAFTAAEMFRRAAEEREGVER